MATQKKKHTTNHYYRQRKCAHSQTLSEIIICFNEFASSGPRNSAHYLQFAKQDNGSVELNHLL